MDEEEKKLTLPRLSEVDRAIDNLIKSGKMFGGGAGGRRESPPIPGPARNRPAFGEYAWDWSGRPRRALPTDPLTLDARRTPSRRSRFSPPLRGQLR